MGNKLLKKTCASKSDWWILERNKPLGSSYGKPFNAVSYCLGCQSAGVGISMFRIKFYEMIIFPSLHPSEEHAR